MNTTDREIAERTGTRPDAVRDSNDPVPAGGWTERDIPNQAGRTFVVTGATRGIGHAAALELARKGARVILPARTPEGGDGAKGRILAEVPNASLEVLTLDLADLESVHGFAARLERRGEPIDGLLNVAGVMATPRGRTVDGFETQFGVNHLGHFALTGLLLPLIGQDGRSSGRIVTMTSGNHRGAKMDFDDLMGEHSYRRWQAYGQSKLANVLFAYELQRRLSRSGSNILSLVTSPGVVRTELGQYGGAQGLLFRVLVPLVVRLRGHEPLGGALGALRAATDPAATGGEYYEPSQGGTRGGPVSGRRTSSVSYDEAIAARLWERSVGLTGVDFGWLERGGSR